MSGDIIARYLDDLSARLPHTGRAALVAEISDGLEDAVEHHRSLGLSDVDAQRAAVEEFGSTAVIAAEYTPVAASRQVHRIGKAFVFTGPLVGGLWVTAVALTTQLPEFTVPIGWLLALFVSAAATCAMFSVIRTSRLGRYMQSRLRTVATILSVTAYAAVVVDSTAIVVLVALVTMTPAAIALLPAVIAGLASLARLLLAARAALALHKTRASLA